MKRNKNDFNIEIYRAMNKDLSNLNDKQILYHYINHGIKEARISCQKDFFNKYPEFNIQIYREMNKKLSKLNDIEILSHYHNYGIKEKSQYSNKSTCVIEKKNDIDDPKCKFRKLCHENIEYIKNIRLPNFMECSDLESVLIEYRCLPHLEFLIRNTILKLGEEWSHTVICGNLNYDFMVNLCSTISNKIKIIKTNYDNLFPSDYSLFLSSLDFWNLLDGKKILIYQEDSIIFKSNIKDFLHWDFIGAPWPENQNDNKNCVGNGGISLRTKDIMIQIINTISIFDTEYNSCTLEYIKNTKSTVPPEDVYFSKNMEDLNIGLLADRNSATNFSTESIVNKNSFAGHHFWLNDTSWENRLFDDNIIVFNCPRIENFYEHRGGWNSILQNLNKNKLYSNNHNFLFYDMLDNIFLFDKGFVIEKKWAGIFHCTPLTPKHLDIANITNVFKNPNFIKSLKNCVCIITLSTYITQFFIDKLNDMNINIPIYTLKHPVEKNNIPIFNLDDFNNNNNKQIIQIGQQLRKVTSIYLLPEIENYNKLWLTGTKNFVLMKNYINAEINLFNIDKNIINTNIMTYLENYNDYDNLLKENIVFVDLYDAAANNTVIECIIRNTPIIINKLPGVIDYLGEDYPLYFETLDEVPKLLTYENICKANKYLMNMKKDDLEIDFFTKELITILYNNFKDL
jgi:hypothetical protein